MSDPTTATDIVSYYESELRNRDEKIDALRSALHAVDFATIDDLKAASEGRSLQQIIDAVKAMRAEIERLTAALATAEAERDAAYAVAKVLVKSEGSINVGGTKIARTGAGYLVSNLSGSGSYGEHQFDAAWSSFVRNAAPQPAAAPAVDAAPVWDCDHLTNAQKWLDSDIFGKDVIAVRKAVQSLILHMQKGEPQS